LLLHIGTHKTGTTSIQRFCAANREQLRAIGCWYPSTSIAGFPDHYAHHRVAHAIAGRDASFGPDDARRFFDTVREQMRDDEVCVISAEPMYRHVVTSAGAEGPETSDSTVVDSASAHAQYIRAVRDCIGEFDVTVMVMLRRQERFLESLYAEQVLSTGYNKSIERYAADRQPLLDYLARLESWGDVFGHRSMSVRVFEPALFEHPIERLFIEWVGVEWSDALVIGSRKNVTLPRSLVEFKRFINVHDQGPGVNTRYREWLDWLYSHAEPGSLPDLGKYYLQPRDRYELMARFDEDNRRIAERYLGEPRLFSEGIERELERYVDRPRLADRDFRRISQQLFRMLADRQLG
jgi:hypothetical protein